LRVSDTPRKPPLALLRTPRSRADVLALPRSRHRPSGAAIAAGETKHADEYAPGRGTCRSCRRAQQREHDRRAALAEDNEPHPPGSQDGHKSRRRLASDRYWNERRRGLIEEARVTTEERDGREYVVRHLAPQFGPVSEFRRASGVSNAPPD